MPARQARPVLRERRGALGVVEDEQPAPVAVEPVAHGAHAVASLGSPGRIEAEGRCEAGVVGGERLRILRAQPADDVIVRSVPVGELEGGLRLADTPKTRESRRARRGGGMVEARMHLC